MPSRAACWVHIALPRPSQCCSLALKSWGRLMVPRSSRRKGPSCARCVDLQQLSRNQLQHSNLQQGSAGASLATPLAMHAAESSPLPWYCAHWDHAGCLQRHRVIIDSCMLGSADSAFMQQAAHVTGGIYLNPKHPAALLQYLQVGIVRCWQSTCPAHCNH